MSKKGQKEIIEKDSEIGTQQDFRVLQRIISVLQTIDHDQRIRIIAATTAFFNIDLSALSAKTSQTTETKPLVFGRPSFSEDTSMGPKEFLLQKQPRTDVERIACLAFYLTHYRDIPYFKTLDLSILNTEAAHPKLSNAATSANNAVKMGYLVPATKGNRQISAAGEQFVRALPDRDAAREAMTTLRPRRTIQKKIGTKKKDE